MSNSEQTNSELYEKFKVKIDRSFEIIYSWTKYFVIYSMKNYKWKLTEMLAMNNAHKLKMNYNAEKWHELIISLFYKHKHKV